MRTLLSIVALATVAVAQPTVVLPVLADTHVDQNQPTTNFATSPNLDFGKHFASNPFRVWMVRGLVQFDTSILSSLPIPKRVRFHWYQDRSRTMAAGGLPVTVHPATQPWSATTATWNNKPTFGAEVARLSVGDSFNSGWKIFDLTALALQWRNGQRNLGIVIKDPTERTAGAARPGQGFSREGPANFRPFLEVSYGGPFGTGCGPSAAPELDVTAGTGRIGRPFTIAATGMPARLPTTFLVGVSNTRWAGAGVNLPFNLGSIGLPQCNVLVSGEAAIGRTASSRGVAELTFSLANNPSLVGPIYFQSFAVNGSARLFATDGLEVHISP